MVTGPTRDALGQGMAPDALGSARARVRRYARAMARHAAALGEIPRHALTPSYLRTVAPCHARSLPSAARGDYREATSASGREGDQRAAEILGEATRARVPDEAGRVALTLGTLGA